MPRMMQQIMVRNRATIVGSMTVTLLLMETTAEIILEARPVAVMQPEMTPAMEQATATVMVPLPPASSASRMRPKFSKLLSKIYLLLPLVVLVWLVTTGTRTMAYSAAVAILATIVVSLPDIFLGKRDEAVEGSAPASKENPFKSLFTMIFGSLEGGTKGSVTVAVACGVAGIISGCITVTGLASKTVEVTVEAAVVGAQSVTFALEGQNIAAPVEDGTAKAVFTLHNAHLWDGVEDPFLYIVSAKLDNGEEASARFGCRKFEFDPQKGFILNGRSYPLRGVSRHQDRKGAGIALTNEMMEEDISIILEMGANTIRLAHYQHAQYFYDLCDEKGLVIWAEIPYITMHMTNGRANTLTQMEELIVQNYNHPCIAVWGLSNEITAASAVNEDLLENHRLLNELAHKLDPTRKTTMANVFMLETTSPILEIPDVNSYNLYFGWYLGELEQNDEFFDKYHADYPDRCIGFSEYGADANPQYQSSHPEKGDYTESYQCVYHEHIAKMIAERPWLWATHVWNMFDFAADGRDEGGKHGENQKGLVTFDRKLKKDPFYLYKAYWSKEPFVHLCGSRYVDRAEDVTEIKVYSNLPEVSLYKDGQLVETKQGDKVFTFQLPITGKHSIEARSGEHSSVILVNKVDAPNPDYAMDNRKNVTNWFDGELDESCWSVKDNMAAAMADPKAGPILKQIREKAAASRGDVAAAVKDNPALVAMMERAMQRMTIQSMLMQAGASEEDIKQLNRVLQGIAKE